MQQLLIFDIALLSGRSTCTCQDQKRTFTPGRRRCNCNAEHCRRGTCSRSPRGGKSGIRTCEASVRKASNPTTELLRPAEKDADIIREDPKGMYEWPGAFRFASTSRNIKVLCYAHVEVHIRHAWG